MSGFVIGQRWISESEPELGLATVVHTGGGRVRVEFESAGEARTYATEQAPLKRVRFCCSIRRWTWLPRRWRARATDGLPGCRCL